MTSKQGMPREVEPVWSRYFHTKGAVMGIPTAGNFELTSRCNFRCKMCYVHDDSNLKGELSAKEWIGLGEQAAKSGMVFLLLTGGEPFLRRDFKEIYSGLKQLGLLLSINTNGSLITEDMMDFLAADPPLRMNISLYGASDEGVERMCGQPAYDRVTRNIKALRDRGIQIRLNSTITPYNAGDVPGLYRFAREEGLPIKTSAYMFPPVRINGCQYGDAPHRFTPEEAAEYTLLCREQELTPERLSRLWIGETYRDEECTDGQGDPMRCRAGRSAFWITWDGRMLPCGMFPGEGYSLKEMGFEEAWQAIRRDCAAIHTPAECALCPHKNACNACVAACLTEQGNCDRPPEYVCRMTKHLDRITREKYPREENPNETK